MTDLRRHKLASYGWSLIVLGCLQCTPGADPKPRDPDFDRDQRAAQAMTDLRPQLVGRWRLRQVWVSPHAPNGLNRLGLAKDSVFQDLAVLTIRPASKPRTTPPDPRRGEYDGTIQYQAKTYPVQFDMWPAARLYGYSSIGPQTYLLFSFQFPDGIHYQEPEEAFLENLGLISETFSLQTTLGQPTMQWVGLNRGIQQIQFVKLD